MQPFSAKVVRPWTACTFCVTRKSTCVSAYFQLCFSWCSFHLKFVRCFEAEVHLYNRRKYQRACSICRMRRLQRTSPSIRHSCQWSRLIPRWAGQCTIICVWMTWTSAGTDNDAQISICSVGFDDHYFSHSGFFGAGAVRDLLCYPLPCRRAYVWIEPPQHPRGVLLSFCWCSISQMIPRCHWITQMEPYLCTPFTLSSFC